jgi:hypothetical protein
LGKIVSVPLGHPWMRFRGGVRKRNPDRRKGWLSLAFGKKGARAAAAFVSVAKVRKRKKVGAKAGGISL